MNTYHNRFEINQFLKNQKYELFYHHQFLEQLKNHGIPIDNPQFFIGINSIFQ